MSIISSFISFLVHFFSSNKDPIQKVNVLPKLNQNLYPEIRNRTESGRLIDNARNNYQNDCQVIYAVFTEIAHTHKKWVPVSYASLTKKVEQIVPEGSGREPIEVALRKKVISVVELYETLYLIPNPQKFKKHLDSYFISTFSA